ncbi:unnamed protein product [Rhizoctonia solani]|uniref:Uncharacterized protein n=1 Tax=Rhizoctonia solani TaxID=456999 RepID=A0A8H3AIL1_9AGAM|nr:unnamed protein product [Rhizoctonia solani]
MPHAERFLELSPQQANSHAHKRQEIAFPPAAIPNSVFSLSAANIGLAVVRWSRHTQRLAAVEDGMRPRDILRWLLPP